MSSSRITACYSGIQRRTGTGFPQGQLAGIIAGPLLWFWGHEHKLAIYDKYAVQAASRLTAVASGTVGNAGGTRGGAGS